ncbi:N-acyl-D-aspartate/D-glutamate deacylase [Enhydrobacter aerosaccus]|uniref:N-acyl-D-aspartate/D-glutamate deacylase n=1 Tax=Enhydrobacter aerosaccus TaxID=225324 RepID=A0A1T4KVC5_9HYPH|nr:amidohydrolase family protein [Enhydrobacter aerosaccus]SJZ46371.1 N-acyl-D-aspartate/D-glutamate deacylase [Enhydrobacter aerosaccus]
MSFDLKIAGGTIVDGTGKPGVVGDIGIKDGKVVAVGKADGDATSTIDATDRVVAPGFVDVHTHYDAQVLWDRMLSISPWHGVTTTVIGNCGFGVAPTRAAHRKLILQTLEKVEGMSLDALQAGLGDAWPFETFPQYLDAVEKRGVAINVAALFGHTPLRLYVMGEAATERAATADELAAMKTLVREAMEAGAIGFGTSKSVSHNGYAGKPVPSRQATPEELDALVSVMGELKRGLMQITIGRDFSTKAMAEVSRKYNIPVTWTALLSYLYGPGGHRKQLDLAAEQRRTGAVVIPQVSCRPLNFEFTFADPFPFEVMKIMNELAAEDARSPGARRRAYADPAWRRKFTSELTPVFQRWWERTVIAWASTARELEEMPLVEVARRLGKDPVDLAFEIALANDLQARFRMAVMNFDETEVAELITDPHTIIALSDAGAHASQLCDACYSTYLLGHWVREKKAFSLEQAVHNLTQRPAEMFGITDRGVLAEGRPADVVVFDPETVGPGPLRRVYDLPAGADRIIADAIGIDAVVVNGQLVRRNGKDAVGPNDRLPGRLLRNGRAH